MDQKCRHCGALYFRNEVTSRMKYTVCCKEGKINLPTPPSDAYIEELLQGITSEAKLFLNNSNFINSRVRALLRALLIELFFSP